MPTFELSEALAQSIVDVANTAGCRTTALLTDMNQVLASSAGNALEVREALQFLTGEERNPRLLEVTMSLGEEMLISGKQATGGTDARNKLQAVLNNGKATESFPAWLLRKGDQETSLSIITITFRTLLYVNRYLPRKQALSQQWIPVLWGCRLSHWAAAAVRPVITLIIVLG